MTSVNNNVTLYHALFIFRNAMLPFIIGQLKVPYGKGWWKAGVERALGKDALENLENQFQRRYKQTLASVKRPGEDVEQMLDIGHFLPIIQRNWKLCFVSTFEEQNRIKVEVWLGEIIEVRNAVAHPENAPLDEEDTSNAFDRMTRLLDLVDQDCANRIRLIREDLIKEETNVQGETKVSPFWLELKEGPHNYGHGINILLTKILQEEGQESEVQLKLIGHRDQLARLLWEKRLRPGTQDDQLEIRIERVLGEMDRLALYYLDSPFADLCVTSTTSRRGFDEETVSSKNDLAQIRKLENEIDGLKHRLYEKQWKKAAQLQTETVIPLLEKEISEIQKGLDEKKDELARLMEEAAPEAFFSVRRRFEPSDKRYFVEEQLIHIFVEILNEGRNTVFLSYVEGLPPSLRIIEGKLDLEKPIEPGQTEILTYSCYPARAGKYQFYTEKIEYQDRIADWDRIEDSTIEVISGTEPLLTGSHYYRLRENGLELLIRLSNDGDKIAHEVEYKEEIFISGLSHTVIVGWSGNIWGSSKEQLVERLLNTTDPRALKFPEHTEVTYKNSQGQVQRLVLESKIKRLEYYEFPVSSELEFRTVGRESEIQTMSEIVDRLWRARRGRADSFLKRVIFLEGIEGTGKTKLVYELINLVQKHGFNYFIDNGKDRSPIKRMLKRLLGLQPDEDDDKLIWQRLEAQLPGEENRLRKELVFNFISTIPSEFSEEQLNLLESHLMVLIKDLCQPALTLLIFEDIHWTPEGVEQRILLKLLHDVLVSGNEPILICVTYRPGEQNSVVRNLKAFPRTSCEIIELNPLKQEHIASLINEIVDFPRFNDSLHQLVFEWSGNPLYIIELLRLLTHPDSKYLTRIGVEWFPNPAIDLKHAIPETIDKVILERVEKQLSAEANELAKRISAIGFELPLKLIEALVQLEFPQWEPEKLFEHLHELKIAGILSMVNDEVYEFEHQLKREVLYESLDKHKQVIRSKLRQQVAEILLSKQVYIDPDEQLRQLARHIVKSPKDFKQAHIQEIKRAAKLEKGLRNFSRSLEFYSTALELVPKESFEEVDLLLERSSIFQMQGAWLAAERDLKRVQGLMSQDSILMRTDRKRAANLRILSLKEQSHVMLRQAQVSLNHANDLLYQARIGLEGNLRLRRFFLPHDFEFHQVLMEVYLDLAEVWLRKRDFKTCRKSCRRAEKIAKHALKKWPGKPLLYDVYRSLGDLYYQQGYVQEDYEHALDAYNSALKYAQDDRYQQERIWLRLADIHRVLGDLDQAQKTYQNAITVQEELGDTHGLALSFGGIGDLLVEQEKYEQGRYYCEKAYTYQQLVSDLDRYWRTCVSLTKVHLQENDIAKAAKYWFDARAILFDQRRFSDLRSGKKREIYAILSQLSQYFHQQNDWEKCRLCLEDKNHLATSIKWDRDEVTSRQLELGETYYKLRQWQKAINAFNEVLNITHSQEIEAEALEWLGDVFSEYEPSEPWLDSETIPLEGVHNTAESYYEKAIQLRLDIGKNRSDINKEMEALSPFGKLLGRIVTDEAGLLQFPFTFLRFLRHTSSSQIRELLVEKATEVLLNISLHVEAGDIAVYAARESAKTGEQIASAAFLARAENLYRQGQALDVIWGLNMLIPTYFRIRQIKEVIRCFEELFELNVQVGDADEFISTLRAIGELREEIETPELEYFAGLALSSHRQIHLSIEQRSSLYLNLAKQFGYIADKYKVDKEEMCIAENEKLALEYYERVKRITNQPSILAVILNDTALIFKHNKDYSRALNNLSQAIQIDEENSNYLSASHTRINRAYLYQEISDVNRAIQDYEIAIEFLKRRAEYWNKREEYQDIQPLSPTEIISVIYDRRWLASAESLRLSLTLTAQFPQQFKGSEYQTTQTTPEDEGSNKDGMDDIAVFCQNCGKQIVNLEQGFCDDCGLDVCTFCGAILDENVTVCPECGTKFDIICPNCEAIIEPEDKVCSNCGMDFTSEEDENGRDKP